MSLTNSRQIEVFIKVNAKKSLVTFDEDLQKFVIFVKSPPTKGKANKEIISLLKNYFEASEVILSRGFASTTKLFEIKGFNEDLLKKGV